MRSRTDAPPAATAGEAAPVVLVEHQVKSYGKGKQAVTAVHDVSFAVYPGEVFGFLGPNGPGVPFPAARQRCERPRAVSTRDLPRWWRDRQRFLPSLFQPILYLFVFGVGLGSALGRDIGTGGAAAGTRLWRVPTRRSCTRAFWP